MSSLVGSLIAGKYRVERVLGQGGMGVVVVAMHDELDQRVAIKFLLPEAVKDGEWVTRFSREAKAAAKIKSEHVVRVFDVGKLEDGAPYMVMEFLDGKDLQSILNDRRRLPVSEAVDYVLQACEALAEAHAAGIVHRDLKPANLFLAHRSDGSPCIKVLDFGISKVIGPNDVSMTSTSAIVGSPLYMSPEQMKAAKNVDKRSDIWSIGVLLQELVTGEPSFLAQTSAELCALVLTAEPTPLRDVMPNAPAELETIVARCLKKDAALRYANVGELARDLLPLAPGAQTSVDRILRMSGAAATTGPRPSIADVSRVVVSHPDADDLSTTEATIPATNMSPRPGPDPMIAAAASTPSLVPAGATMLSPGPAPMAATNAAWGGTAKPASSSRVFVFAAVGVLALGGIGAGIFMVTRPQTPTPGSASVDPSHAPTATTSTASTQATAIGAAATTTTVTATQATTSSPPSIPLSALPTAQTTVVPTGRPRPSASVAVSAKPPASAPTGVNTSGFGGRN